MNGEIKVSVIVPVYNTELYLRQCLDSIVNQTLREIEIICVDDGSTDQSAHIIEEYITRDERVYLLRQRNQYAGVARNNGMSHARGKYLVFWDSDDFFALSALEKMYKQSELDSADICICGGKKYFSETGDVVSHPAYLNPKMLPDKIPFSRLTHPDKILNITPIVPWNKMFRKEFVKKSGIVFQPIRNGNDIYFGACLLGLADRITVVNEELVFYRANRANGLVNTLNKSPLSPIQAWIDAANTLQEKNAFPERSFSNRALASMLNLLNDISDLEQFKKAFLLLQKEGLQKMHIFEREKEYYYNVDYMYYVMHLWHDTPEQFLMFKVQILNADKFKLSTQNKKLKEKIQTEKKKSLIYKKKMQKYKESSSYKLGYVLLWIPIRIKNYIMRQGK